MPFVTVSRGGPSQENDIPDGVYPLVLVEISDPRTVSATRGVNAGKDIDLIDWTWAINIPGHPLDSRTLTSSTSTASGPKSKMFSYLTALLGGVAPQPDTTFEKNDLAGRQVYGTINHDEDGWNRLANVSAIPVTALQQRFGQATGAPTVNPPAVNPIVQQPVPAAPVAAPAAPQPDLPF